MQQKLLDMKNNFQETENDSNSASSEAEKQLQLIRRLQKEIKQKDMEITNLTESLCSIRDEVIILSKQVSNERESLKKYKDLLVESDSKVFELTNELEKKISTIKYLNDEKTELEHFIGECRSSNRNSRYDMNTSSDCLDNSFMRTNATLSPTQVPENMSSVVDMQLREKVREVQQLQQDLLSLKEKNALLIKGIKEQANLISESFNVPLANIMTVEHTLNADAVEYFQIFVLELRELHQLYFEDLDNMRKLQDKIRALTDKNIKQNEELVEHKDRIEGLESENMEMSQQKTQLESRLNECVNEITLLISEKKQALEQLENTRETLHKEYASLKTSTDKEIQQLRQEKEQLQNHRNTLLSDVENYRLKLQESQEDNVRLNKHNKMEKETLQEKLQQHVNAENVLKEKYEALKKQERYANAHLDKMQTLLHDKEKEMLVLGEEISEVRALNTELERRMEELSEDFKLERQQSDERITKLKECENQLLKELEAKTQIIALNQEHAGHIKAHINKLLSLCDINADENDGQLLQNLQEIEKTVAKYKQDARTYEEQVLNLKEQLESLVADNMRFQQELKVVIEKHNDAKLHLKQKEKSNKQMDEEMRCLREQKEDISKGIAVLEDKIMSMKSEKMNELEQKHIEISNMRKQEKDLLHKLKVKEEDHEHIKSQHEACEAELSKCKQKLANLELSLTEQAKEIVELKESQEFLQQQKAEEIHHLTNKVQYFETELRNNSLNFAKQQKEHEAMLEAVENTLKLTKLQLRETEERLSKATRKWEELDLSLKENKLKHQQTRQKLLEKENEILKMQQLKLEADEEAHKHLKQTVKTLQKNLEEQQSQMERTDASLLNMLATLENVANSAMELASPADDLDNIFNISQLDNTQPNLQHLKRWLNKLLYKLTVLEQEVALNQEELDTKNKQLLDVAKKMHSIQEATEFKTQEFAEKLLNSEKNIDQLENEVKVALAKTQELKKELEQLFERSKQTEKEKNLLQYEIEAEREKSEQTIKELTESKNTLEKKLNSLSELFDKCLDMKQQAEAKLSILEENHKKLQEQLKENEEKQWNLEQEKTALQEQNKTNQEKLGDENAKLNKRIEQLALKLGEAQARGNNLEREQKKSTEAQQAVLEALQIEKEKLLNENKTLQDRLAKSEGLQEQLTTRVSQLDAVNGKFQAATKQLQNDKDEMEAKLQQIQRQRETQEEKLRKLNADLEQYEQNETHLKLEVGALNSQLEVKSEVLDKLEMERKEQMEKQNAQAKQMEDLIAQVAKLNSSIEEREGRKDEQLQNLQEQMKHMNTEHGQQVQKLLEKIKQLQEEQKTKIVEFHNQSKEMAQLLEKQEMLEEKLQKSMLAVEAKESELLMLRTEKDQLAEQEQLLEQQLQESEQQREKIIVDRVKQEECLRRHVEAQLAERLEICAKLEAQLKGIEKSELTHREQLNLHLGACEEMLEKEQQVNAQLRTDNQILQAKYADVKQRLQEQIKLSDERIKENRLELEGKLEKMKNKMVSLKIFEVILL